MMSNQEAVAGIGEVGCPRPVGGDHRLAERHGLSHSQPKALGAMKRYVGIAGMHERAVLATIEVVRYQYSADTLHRFSQSCKPHCV